MENIKNFYFKYWHTIKNLKFSQIIWRLYYIIYSPKIQLGNWPRIGSGKKLIFTPILKERCYIGDGNFVFLSRVLNIKETGWNSSEYPKLWLYNLNYFDFVNQELSSTEKSEVQELISDWVLKNDIGRGISWEPYPTSLRIVNLIKWFLLGNKFPKGLDKSLVYQVRYLAKKIEWHIEGNHLLANAKALIFAGIFFQGPQAKYWQEKGIDILLQELDKQILGDGAHFELSPMYHSIILEDILDIINLFISFDQRSDLTDRLRLTAKKMIDWLSYLTHPDGKISHFNDASMDAVCSFSDLKQYANSLGVEIERNIRAQCDLSTSGFVISRLGASNLFVDAGEIGPLFQPGHGHADTLSFELSVFDQRVFVNTGISTYEKGSVRMAERGTSSHNTVEINNENSSEVWASFRVGRRAKIVEKFINFGFSNSEMEISHSGYSRLKGSPVHKRYIQHSLEYLRIVDKIIGTFSSAVGRLHIHPDVKIINITHKQATLAFAENISITIKFISCSWQINEYFFCYDFGSKIKSKCIEYSINDSEGEILIEWFEN